MANPSYTFAVRGHSIPEYTITLDVEDPPPPGDETYDYGSISVPTGTAVDQGTLLVPSGPELDFGSIIE